MLQWRKYHPRDLCKSPGSFATKCMGNRKNVSEQEWIGTTRLHYPWWLRWWLAGSKSSLMSPRRLSMQFLVENCSIPVSNSMRIQTQSQFLLPKVVATNSGRTTTDVDHTIGDTPNQNTSKLENYIGSQISFTKKSQMYFKTFES